MSYRKEGHWISPCGDLHKIEFQDHARSIAKLLRVKFQEKNILHLYDVAFKKGYIRVAIFDDTIMVQLEKPANYEQRKIIQEYLEEFGSVLVIFGKIEGEVITKRQLNKALSGQNPFKDNLR